MAQAKKTSVKHVQIDKNQSSMLAVIVLATVLAVFGLFATKSMVEKGLYQRRVLHARRDIVATLKSNYTAAQTLVNRYNVFQQQDPNVLGGSVSGNGAQDGDNARIVLDALPSDYDVPALATSIEKVITERGVSINSLSITDDPASNPDQPEGQPQSKPITFSFQASTNYDGAAKLLQDFERSIRPFDLNTLEITGTDQTLSLSVGMTTYYQPAKSLDLTPTKEVQ